MLDEDSIIDLLPESAVSAKPVASQPAFSSQPPVKAKIKPPPIPASGAAQIKLIPGNPSESSKKEQQDDSEFWEAVGQ